MKNLIEKFDVTNPLVNKMVRYLVMAVLLVLLEMSLFFLFNSVAGIHYVASTGISFIFIVILNWYGSRRIVFKSYDSNIKKEMSLVLLGSITGISLQVAITAFFVEILGILPIIGKGVAIFCVFFWNFWFRLKYVFK